MPRQKRKPVRSISPSEIDSFRAQKRSAYRIDSLFEYYANKSSGLIEPEGIDALCKDVHMDNKDIRIMILAWKMKAEKQGYFSKDEWRRGLKCLGADRFTKFKKVIDGLEKEVMAPECFEDFYSYAFQYNLEDKQTAVDIETACELFSVVLRFAFPPQVDLVIEYLKTQRDYGVLNIDHWRSFYRFFKEVRFLGLENYDSRQAWPVMIHKFVEWLKQGKKASLVLTPSSFSVKLSSANSKP